LRRLVRGELDWVVMKALEKDRGRRYESASAFAADVQRYLADEPVQAGPPSAWYRLRKFARRNRARLGLAACVLAAVAGFAGSGVVFAWQRAARQAETDRVVTAALAQAQTLVAEGDKQTDHPERWQATARLAKAAQEKAEELLAAGAATPELAERVRQVGAAVEGAVTDSGLRVELDRIALEKAAVNEKESHFDEARVAPRYAKLLGDYGVDPVAPEAAATRVRTSRLREVLLSALADWIFITRDPEEQRRVAKVYQLALPPNSLRLRMTAAVRRRDGVALAKLAREPAFQDLPVASLVILEQSLTRQKEWAAAEQLLRAGLERSPGDFWLNHDLGVLLLEQQPPRAEEAVPYLTAALALRPDNPGVHLNLGAALAEKGDVEGALRHYQAAIRLAPNYSVAQNNLGNALHARRRLDEAIAAYREALRLNEDYPEAHNNLGNALADKGQLDDAIAECREALRLKKDFPPAHINLGNALYAKGRLDDAIAEYEQALRSRKDFPEAYKAHGKLGEALAEKGRVDEAIAAYREAIRLRKEYPEAHTNLGFLFFRQGRLDAAIAEYKQALQSRKDFPEAYMAHHKLGDALTEKGRLDEAIAEYKQALRSRKDFPQAYKAHNSLGIALAHQGRLDEAIIEYRSSIRLKKDGPEAHHNLGNALAHKGRLDEAIDAYRAALEIKKDVPEVHSSLGDALRKLGRLKEAIAECRKAIRLDKASTGAHNNLGLALAAQGRSKEAIAAYREALRLKPDFPEAHDNLGNALRGQGKREEAIAAYREALRLKPDFPEAHNNLGNALREKGLLDEAVTEYREALRLQKDLPEAHYNLGLALLQQGQFRQAVEELRRGDELGSRNPRWPHAQTQLQIRHAEQMARLDDRLPDVLRGKDQPKDAAERVAFAQLCQLVHKQYSAAARFYGEAFAAQPTLAEQLGAAGSRYDAACAAALAGCGQGQDAGKLDDKERSRLRKQARDWLSADLLAWRGLLEKEPAKAGPAVAGQLAHWLEDTDFAGVRGEPALAQLPEAERGDWLKLWQEVEGLRQRAARPPEKAAASRP
jgi:tetratricopeptide (TPR) repeat protein